MGKKNRARRAAKVKSKAKSESQKPSEQSFASARPPGGDTSGGSHWGAAEKDPLVDPELVARLLVSTARAVGDDDHVASDGVRSLAAGPQTVVDRRAELLLLAQVAAIWNGGWQPAELHRQCRLRCPAAGARLAGLAIATDHTARRSTTLDTRWIAQVEALDLPPVNGKPGWLTAWTIDELLDREQALATVVQLFAFLMSLRRLDAVLPPPGSAEARRSSGTARSPSTGTVGAASNPVLDRIRGLLAKAESSTFEAEATAFTAKAQELMTRHAIDAALLGNHDDDEVHPVNIRIQIDAPYVDAKSLLLQIVAESGRCRAVLLPELAMSSVLGFADDVAAVELLFTSLLLQAESALRASAREAPPGTRVRSQSYRSAFLVAFGQRISERLQEINEAVFTAVEAEQGGAFLPVLRTKASAVDDFVNDRFGNTRSSAVRGGYSIAGWAGGTAAADDAKLNAGNLPKSTSA